MRRLITDAEYIRDRCEAAPTGCWEWRRYRYSNGYGQATFGGERRLAHRLAYEAFVGPIPEGLTIDHLCRNPGCVNPEHLEAVPIRVNLLRGDTVTARNAAKTHCPRGHAYTDHRNKHGARVCLKCREEKRRERGVRPYDPDHCKNGHPWTEENTVYVKTGRSCKICKAEYMRRRRGPWKQRRNKPTHCPHGHEYTPENSGMTRAGYRYCRECDRQQHRRSHAAKRARA